MTTLSASRICLIAATTLGITACGARHNIPPPSPPLTTASPPADSAGPAGAPATRQPTPGTAPRSSSTTPVPKVAPPVAKTPAPITRAPQPASPPAAAPLDLDALTKQLKETKAIGLFSKIALKNQIEDLLDEFRRYYQGNSKTDMAELRRSYNLLLMKVLSLLQDEDKKLSASIVSSREAIWDLLANPKKFATLKI